MREATYYLKARFSNQAALTKRFPKIRAFIEEGSKAESWWQDHRNEPDHDKFWNNFKLHFPLMAKYLESQSLLDKSDSSMNILAGRIDFPALEGDANLSQDGPVLSYSGTCWHFADWTPLCRFLESEFGAIKADWISDEYADVSELVNV